MYVVPRGYAGRVRRWKGPIVLLLLQVAPVRVARDSSGAIQVTLGFADGQFEKVEYSCEGSAIGSEAIAYRSGGALVEYWKDSHLRISMSGGFVSFDNGQKPFGAFQVAREGVRGGIGVGFATVPRGESFGSPATTKGSLSTYLRLGSQDGVHLRFDSYYPSFAHGMTGDAWRLGVGYNRLGNSRASGFAGFGQTPYGEGGVFTELFLPVSAQLGISLAGRTQRSHQYRDAGLGVGVRYQWPR